MKFKFSLLAGLAALGFASSASAQTVINITGATAFRAAANQAIVQLLSDGGNFVPKYCFVGSSLTGSNKIIVEGQIGGQDFIIRTSQQGSTGGIASVVNGTPPTSSSGNPDYLDVTATAGLRIAGGASISEAGNTVAGQIPIFTFSDVAQDISATPSPALIGEGVGVVPFVFVANVGAPAALTNMTDQLHEAQWRKGQLPLSMYTGNPADTKPVLNTGRSNSSGTRATILAETQYGPFTQVLQWGGPNSAANVTGAEGAGAVSWLQFLGNGGYSSNSYVRQLLSRTSTSVDVSTDAAGNAIPGDGGANPPIPGTQADQDVVIVSYLTLSDAAVITNVTGGAGVGAKALTYNGVPYSEENVKNGTYTLWGYQQWYHRSDASQTEVDVWEAIRDAIPQFLDPIATGIPTPDMNVTRSGGDGGPISPNTL